MSVVSIEGFRLRKLVIYTSLFLVLSVAPIMLVVMECRKSLDEQYVYFLERRRIAIIGMGEEFYRLSHEKFRQQLICEIYETDQDFKRVIKGKSEDFLRSANVVSRNILSRADNVYDLFEISENDLTTMCQRDST